MYTPSGDFKEAVAYLEGFISGRAGASGPIGDRRAFEEWLARGVVVPSPGNSRHAIRCLRLDDGASWTAA